MKELLKKLNQSRAAKAEAMKILLETAGEAERALTIEEGKTYDELEREYDELTAQIERMEKQQARENELDEPQRAEINATPTKPTNPNDVEVDTKRYSLFRALHALSTGDWSRAEYERDLSLKIAERTGKEAKGIFIPTDVQRSVLTTANTGALVGTEHRDDLYIEALQASSIVVGLGAKVLTELVGNVDIPKALGGIEFGWIDEDADAPETSADFATLPLRPKTIAGAVAISRRLLKQSTPSVEALIEADIRSGVGLAIDKAVLGGDGSNGSPVGILSTTGVNTQTVADSTDFVPEFAEVVGFETTLAEDNALRGNLAYVTTPKIAGLTKTKPIDAGSGVMLNMNNQMNGYKVVGTSLLPADKVVFGNFSDIIIGMWGTMDLVLDTATKASSGGLVIRVFQDIDVGIRHEQSFCINA